MLNYLMKLKTTLVTLLQWAVIAVMAALVLDVVWQVFTRYVLNSPSPWTEELATMLLMWGALLGASVAFARKAHLGVDFFVGRLGSSSRRVAELYSHATVAAFALLVLIYGGTQLVIGTLATNQVSAAIGVKMGYVYLALPISGLFILLFSIEDAVETLASESDEEEQHG